MTVALVGHECPCPGSCSRDWEPAYPKKRHMDQNERKEGPMAAFQCISKRALVAKELGNPLWETGGENMWKKAGKLDLPAQLSMRQHLRNVRFLSNSKLKICTT